MIGSGVSVAMEQFSTLRNHATASSIIFKKAAG